MKLFESIDIDWDDFDDDEEDLKYSKFHFIIGMLNDVRQHSEKSIIIILPKSKFEEFNDFCWKNEITNYLNYDVFGEDDKIYVYILNYYGKLDTSFMPINRGDYASKYYPFEDIYTINENFNFDDYEEEEEKENVTI
jgi:hypothetical protein